jgi:hypothetical protein
MTAVLTAGLDGPHSDDRTTGAAALAAEAFRLLAYATGRHCDDGLTWPQTACTVTGGLDLAVSRLPQTARQLAAWLAGEAAAGRVGDDKRRDPAEVTARACARLETAARHAEALSAALAAAHCDLGHLYQADAPGAAA